MKKDAFYFPHDSNARGDPKTIRLRRIAGLEGYGFFWCVIEMLRDAKNYRLGLDLVDDIAFELRADRSLFDALFSCELLKKDEEFFWSESLSRRMASFDEKREQARSAGLKSAAKRTVATTENQRPFNDSSTTVQPKRVKESKGDKIKEEDITASSSPLPENAKTSIDSSSDRNELAAALGKIQVSDAEMLTWQQLKALKCTITDVEAARKRVGKNSLNYLKNSVCEARDKRTAAEEPQGVDLEEYFGKGTKLQ